uniref:Uncharacterized protein n=1 Tax=Candidatus Kentrum sp. TC TaxID=2126339 RepID=A0A450Z4U7_9GAMM|nr:MAG: hypothetical protein BECKTC1821E_GA0114239_11348 [Candidatus Kentron sp. TC]VFK52228.1 MAG: hypothetical protein BECKTC1821D_GA0114238_11598 [Candidatus Kentron sp. TC]
MRVRTPPMGSHVGVCIIGKLELPGIRSQAELESERNFLFNKKLKTTFCTHFISSIYTLNTASIKRAVISFFQTSMRNCKASLPTQSMTEPGILTNNSKIPFASFKAYCIPLRRFQVLNSITNLLIVINDFVYIILVVFG